MIFPMRANNEIGPKLMTALGSLFLSLKLVELWGVLLLVKNVVVDAFIQKFLQLVPNAVSFLLFNTLFISFLQKTSISLFLSA